MRFQNLFNIGDGTDQQQTVARRKDSFRCCSHNHHRFRAGARHQWLSAVRADTGSGIRPGAPAPVVRIRRLRVACLRHSGQRKPVVIVENGRLDRKNMRVNHITEHDLEEDMRLDAEIENLSEIKVARVERSGDISFIKAK
jgi:Protein of unknown function (DUF421)